MTLGGGSFCRCIWSDSEVCFQGKTGEGNRKMDEREREGGERADDDDDEEDEESQQLSQLETSDNDTS